MVLELGVSSIVPSNGSVIPAPPFAPRGPSGRFPRFIAPTAALRLPVAPRLARLRFARRFRRSFAAEATGSPRFLGNPRRTCPALRPRWDRRARPFGRLPYSSAPSVLPSALADGVGSHDFDISGLNRTACTLAVYASQPRSPVRPRKTRFRLVALPWPGGIRTRWVATRFRHVGCYMASSWSRLAWRT